MAARLNKRQADNVKLAIKTGLLVKMLQDHALDGKNVLTRTRLDAAKILLAKTLPDLAKTEWTGEDGGPLVVKWEKS